LDSRSDARHFVEIRLLRYVIAVGEELHFGKAANRLHLSAPTLSKQIKDLERVLGYRLFERKTREITLTAAGAAFTYEARLALLHAERAVEFGRAASRGDTGVLSLGYSPWFKPSLLVAFQAAFAERLPKTRLALQSAYSGTQIDLLHSGKLQAGIVELPVHSEGLETHRLWRDELVVALPENHRLAGQSQVDRRDLTGLPMIWASKTNHPALTEPLVDSGHWGGQLPVIAHEVNTVAELLDLVSNGAGIGFVKRSIAQRTTESGVAFRELSGPGLFIDTGVVYRSENQSEALRTLLQLLLEQAT
jgi:DNA-binding transcriptional LysR family regulator